MTDFNFIYGTNKRDVLLGPNGKNNHIQGFGGNDKIWGGKRNDILDGGYGNDKIYGYGGEDVYIGGPGKDKITGRFSTPLSGVVQYKGKYDEYKLSVNKKRTKVKSLANDDGIDTIKKVANLQFVDGIYNISELKFYPTPEPDPDPTPDPDPDPTPEPEPEPTPEPIPEVETLPFKAPPADKGPQDFWTYEPLFEYQYALDNTGQAINGKPAGYVGADAGVKNAYSRIANKYDQIDDLNNGANIIGIVDSGVRLTHKDLSSNILADRGYDFGDNDDNPSDYTGHGTHVAGIAAAPSNSFGVIGANPVANIIPVKVTSGTTGSANTFTMLSGIEHAVLKGAKVINLSMGGYRSPNAAEYQGYKQIGENYDALIVISAGNEGEYRSRCTPYYCPESHFPAAYDLPNILSVGSADQRGFNSNFSNYGSAVDIYAPGSDILSTYAGNDDSFIYLPGTSMAAPLVSGIASAYWSRLPHLNYSDVRSRIIEQSSSVDKIDMESVFFGNSSPYSNSSKLQEPQEASDRKPFSLSPVFESLEPAINSENIKRLKFNEESYMLIGTLPDGQYRRAKVIEKITSRMLKSGNKLSKLLSFEVSPMGGVFALELDPSLKPKTNRSLLKLFLSKKWTSGFDFNQEVSYPDPSLESDLLAGDLNSVSKINGTTVKYPDDVDQETYSHSLFFGQRDDEIISSPKNSFIATGKGDDLILGGGGADYLIGDNGRDSIYGGDGQDYLLGGSGDDFFDGGSGTDVITTGKGFDLISPSKGKDTVTDFDIRADQVLAPDGYEIQYNQKSDGLLISFDNSSEKIKIFLDGVNESEFIEYVDI